MNHMAHPARPTARPTAARSSVRTAEPGAEPGADVVAGPASAKRSRDDAAERSNLAHHDAHMPKGEPWLKVLLLAVVPVMLGLVLPRVFLLPLSAVSVALFVASLVMLSRQSRGQSTGSGP